MKKITLLFVIGILGACSPNSNETSETPLGDTIQTASGLQYYYLKRGEGRKVQSGAEVGTYLSLKVGDSVVWTSANDTDSLFTYIADFSRVIKGFGEMTMLMRQGDEVVAILPDSLAYGARGAGDLIPPHSTLVYDQFRMVKVDEPKGILSDTLFDIHQSLGMDAMIERYDAIVSGSDSSKYHRGTAQLYDLWHRFNQQEMHQEAADFASYFADRTRDNGLRYYMVLSFEHLGRVEEALDSLVVIMRDEDEMEVLKEKKLELEAKLSN